MIRHKLAALLGGFLGIVLLSLSLPQPTGATAGAGGNGLKISPVVTNLIINPGQTQTVAVHIQNITNAPVVLQVLVNDFTTTNDESGTPALLLNPNQYAPSHSLKRFVAPINGLSLQPGEDKAVNAVITIPKGTPGGGYYGAIRFAPAPTSGTSNITLSASVGSLILVKVPGSIKEDLRLVSLDVRQGTGGPQTIFTNNKNLAAAVRFENQGDVQEQPFGKISVKNGKTQVLSGEINDTTPRGNVLPESIRKFTMNLTQIGPLGKYTITGNFGYGTQGQLLSGQTTFYVIPLSILITVIAAILLIIGGILGLPRLVRAYNRSVIAKSTRRR